MNDYSRVVAWKIWYADSYDIKTFSSAEGSWDEAPSEGVMVVMTYLADHTTHKDAKGRTSRIQQTGGDWYFSDGDQLFGYNKDSREDNKKRYPQCSFKRGVWGSVEEYRRKSQMAVDDYGVGWLGY